MKRRMKFCTNFSGREWTQHFGVVVSGWNEKWAGGNGDEVTVRGSFTVHTSIHLILYNSD